MHAPAQNHAASTAIAHDGARHDALVSQAARLRNRGLGGEELFLELHRWNETNCIPPLPDGEVRSVARSFEHYPRGEARNPRVCLPNDPIESLMMLRHWDRSAFHVIGAFSQNGEVFFPMRDHKGNVVGHRRRKGDGQTYLINGQQQKCITMTGEKNGLMYPVPFPPEGQVIVTEGEADLLAVLTAGWDAAVGTPGATPGRTCTSFLQKMLAGREVILVPDPDESGRKWLGSVGTALLNVRCSVSFIPAGDGDLDKRLRSLAS